MTIAKKTTSVDLELGVLARGAQKVFENAEALFREAKLLSAEGALSRALFLHQISLEECANIETMAAWAASVLVGLPVEGNKVLKALTKHGNKNRTNAYMLEGSAAEEAAKQRGDWEVARAEFKKLQEEFHEESNAAKNASIYVDFEEGEFVAPVDRITEEMVSEIAVRNEEFLALMYPNVETILKWAEAPEEARKSLLKFFQRVEAIKKERPDDVMAAFRDLIDSFLQERAGGN
jgi:AbiV family abortive infection protein